MEENEKKIDDFDNLNHRDHENTGVVVLQQAQETAEKKCTNSVGKIISSIFLLLILLFIAYTTFCIIRYRNEINNFRSFDLNSLNQRDFIIQTVEFKKFFVQGTEVSNPTDSTKYTDELQIFHVSGNALISFTEMKNLFINETDCDYENKILRLKHSGANVFPFKAEIEITEKDIQKVASMESKEMNFLGMKKDLIKLEMSQAEIMQTLKKELQEEFEKQIFGNKSDSKNLESLEIYQTFLRQLTEIIKTNSQWEKVEIEF